MIALVRALAVGVALAIGAGCGPARDDALLTASWATYRATFITPDGRVVRPEHGGDTVSEGQAYALLRAAWTNDRETFERVWEWTRSHLERRGRRWPALLAWAWSPASGVTDWNVASDADSDVALALLAAAERWPASGAYRTAALAILADLIEHSAAIDDHGLLMLLPGAWADQRADGGGMVLNPSYFAPASFRVFHEATGDPRWLQLAGSSYVVLEATCGTKPASLPPDWLRWFSAERWHPEGGRRGATGWDAVRVPWRIATDALWFHEPRARDYLAGCVEPHVLGDIGQGMAIEYDEAGHRTDPADHPLSNALYAFGLSRPADRDRLLLRAEQRLTRHGADVYFGEPDHYYVNSLAYLPFLARSGRYSRP